MAQKKIMETIEVLFEQIPKLLEKQRSMALQILDIVEDLKAGRIDLMQAGEVIEQEGLTLTKGGNSISILNLIVSKKIRHEIRNRILNSDNTENFIYGYLFFILKCLSDISSSFSLMRGTLSRHKELFEKAQEYYKSQNDNSGGYSVTVSPPYDNIYQIVVLSRSYLVHASDVGNKLLQVIGKEFSIKYEDVGKLFEQPFNLMPLPIPKLKQIFANTDIEKNENRNEEREQLPILSPKIKWAGGLKEFAELINELENKGWIMPIAHGELSSLVKTIVECFDFSGTKRTDESNSFSSLMQYLKPSERENKIYTKRYIKKFDAILVNTSKK